MGNDVIYIPPCLIQRFPCGFVFILAGQFLFPPRPVVDAEQRACGVELPQLSLIVRVIRFQNAVLISWLLAPPMVNIRFPQMLKAGPASDAGRWGVWPAYQAAVPLADWIVAEQIIVFMVSADEQRGKGPGLQPVQPLLLRIAAIPDTAEVSTKDEVILFGQVTLLMECCRRSLLKSPCVSPYLDVRIIPIFIF